MCDNQKMMPGDDKLFNKEKYLQIVGTINYPAVLTRPDLLYAISRAAQKCSKPTYGDYRRVIRIIRYIKGTIDLKLTFTISI